MNKTLAAAAAIFAATSIVASSATYAQTLWKGDLFVTAASPSDKCSASRKVAGDIWQAVFMPAGLIDNRSSDHLMFFGMRQHSTFQMKPTSGALLDKATNVTAIIISGGGDWAGQIPLNSMSVAPAKPTALTETITVKFSIADKGCTESWSGVLARWPFN